jgi:hypothetical protein
MNDLEPQKQPPKAPQFRDLWGTLRNINTVPTWTPRGRLEDSLALYINGTTYRLYVYDVTNSAWRYATLT